MHPGFNDFAVHDFANSSALIETPLQNPPRASSHARRNDSDIHDSVEFLFYTKSGLLSDS
jgi:hypothetical protein